VGRTPTPFNPFPASHTILGCFHFARKGVPEKPSRISSCQNCSEEHPPGDPTREGGPPNNRSRSQEMVSSLCSCRLPCTPQILGKGGESDRGSRAQTPVSRLAGSHLHGKRTPGSVLQDGQPAHPRAGVLRIKPEWKGEQTETGHGRPHPSIPKSRRRRGGSHPSRILQRINPAQVVPVLHTLGASHRIAPVSYPPVTQATISRGKSPSLVQLCRKPEGLLSGYLHHGISEWSETVSWNKGASSPHRREVTGTRGPRCLR